MIDLTYGVVILSAKKATPIPILPTAKLEDHISGSVFQGSVGGVSPHATEHHFPHRGRSYRLMSNREDEYHEDLLKAVYSKPLGEAQDFRSHFASACLKFTHPGKQIILSQSLPFGFVGLHSNEGGLRLFGVSSKSCELLVWTNSPDVDRLYSGDGRREWCIHRFKERPCFSTVVFTRRVCQRWYRWSSTLHSADLKFQALEASLLSHEDERIHSIATPEHTWSEKE